MTEQRFGHLNGLVHNAAAASLDGTVVDLDEKQWRLELDVSLTGAFLVSKFAVPLIVESGGGSVVFIASQFGHVAVAKSPAYCAAKAGLINLAKAMVCSAPKKWPPVGTDLMASKPRSSSVKEMGRKNSIMFCRISTSSTSFS